MMNNSMRNQNANNMSDKDLVLDGLNAQKKVAADYNMFATECSCQQLKSDFMNILNDEQQIQTDLFTEAQNRGWYPVAQAEQQKVDQARQKYSNMSF